MTSDLLIALYVGLSIPVVGAGIALNQGASIPNTVLGFAILVGLGRHRCGALLGRGLSKRAANRLTHIDPKEEQMASAPIRDQLGDHLITPRRTRRSWWSTTSQVRSRPSARWTTTCC